jgi:excinuclease UvrABC ATPase subunit
LNTTLDVIKFADWIIDLGPEGGDKGGKIIAEGTLDEIMKNSDSWTGKFLKNTLTKTFLTNNILNVLQQHLHYKP